MKIIELENKDCLGFPEPEYRLITKLGSRFRIRQTEEGVEITSEGMEFTAVMRNHAVKRQMINRRIDTIIIGEG